MPIRDRDNTVMSPTYKPESRTHQGCKALFIRQHIKSNLNQLVTDSPSEYLNYKPFLAIFV